MAKKEYREVPVEELTDEELKRGFQRLRELYKWEQHHVHEVKVERWLLKVERDKMKKQIRILTNENKFLKEKIERLTMKLNKLWEQKEKKEKPIKSEKVDFKKKFFDSL